MLYKFNTTNESTPSKPPKEFKKLRKNSNKPQLPLIWKKSRALEKSINGAFSRFKSIEEKAIGSTLKPKRIKAIKNNVTKIIEKTGKKGLLFILLTT